MSGDFEKYFERLRPTIKKIAYKLSGRNAYFDIDDLCQEAYKFLWDSHLEGRHIDKTDSFMLQGCYFYLKNYLRTSLDKAKIVSIFSLIDDDDSAFEEILACDNKENEQAAEELFLADSIKSKNLSAREEEIVRLRMEGCTTRAIGAKLGISHVMVSKLTKNIRIKCKDIGLELAG